MIKSMTGFGQATASIGDLSITVEIKSLNSKFMDLNVRLPRLYAEKELSVRNLVSDQLERGKISVSVDCNRSGKAEVLQHYNEELFIPYYNKLKRLADRAMAPYENLFQIALNSPEVIENNAREEINPEDWEVINGCIQEALNSCDEFRKVEGATLQKKLDSYCESIESALAIVESLDPKRIEKVRSRIKDRVEDFFGEEGFDQNRLEQEIIFYIEKLDIHEERV